MQQLFLCALLLGTGLVIAKPRLVKKTVPPLKEITANDGVILDLKYATKENFTKEILYPCMRAFLVPKAAQALLAANKEFLKCGYRIKIWDAYRPHSVQYRMWELVPDERYVGDPKKGSSHNRGCAVDITLVDAKSGIELDMGTGFDDFTDKAQLNYAGLTEQQKRNRELLGSVMKKHKFKEYLFEWWHFSFVGWDKEIYPLLDVRLDQW